MCRRWRANSRKTCSRILSSKARSGGSRPADRRTTRPTTRPTDSTSGTCRATRSRQSHPGARPFAVDMIRPGPSFSALHSEPSRAEPSRAEPSRAEPSRVFRNACARRHRPSSRGPREHIPSLRAGSAALVRRARQDRCRLQGATRTRLARCIGQIPRGAVPLGKSPAPRSALEPLGLVGCACDCARTALSRAGGYRRADHPRLWPFRRVHRHRSGTHCRHWPWDR